ncbi:hypothetical protein SAMN04489718_3232 [Actinopolyspora saharensis]|uniref:Uncharacterized protein n=1 Tax=Actinopolyspora saharensis TaxID=995062 RepID=A0A1H1FTV7_9ACTN|nr:hypothetical protein SAMN04489718_3232 [Actinopolyspora saharensis]
MVSLSRLGGLAEILLHPSIQRPRTGLVPGRPRKRASRCAPPLAPGIHRVVGGDLVYRTPHRSDVNGRRGGAHVGTAGGAVGYRDRQRRVAAGFRVLRVDHAAQPQGRARGAPGAGRAVGGRMDGHGRAPRSRRPTGVLRLQRRLRSRVQRAPALQPGAQRGRLRDDADHRPPRAGPPPRTCRSTRTRSTSRNSTPLPPFPSWASRTRSERTGNATRTARSNGSAVPDCGDARDCGGSAHGRSGTEMSPGRCRGPEAAGTRRETSPAGPGPVRRTESLRTWRSR